MTWFKRQGSGLQRYSMRAAGTACVALVLCSTLQAGVFRCSKADGTQVFQDSPCEVAGTSRTRPRPPDRTASPVLQAAIKVQGTAAGIEQMQRWCAREDYPSALAISEARRGWTSKHATLLQQAAQTIQARLSRDERREVASQVKAVGEAEVQKLAGAAREERQLWCHAAAARIAAPEMDLLAQPKLLEALGNPR
ncbi:MAG: hypothetical protein U1F63_01065 [Chitinivorax sp.]